jgi:hypothetical protein
MRDPVFLKAGIESACTLKQTDSFEASELEERVGEMGCV